MRDKGSYPFSKTGYSTKPGVLRRTMNSDCKHENTDPTQDTGRHLDVYERHFKRKQHRLLLRTGVADVLD